MARNGIAKISKNSPLGIAIKKLICEEKTKEDIFLYVKGTGLEDITPYYITKFIVEDLKFKWDKSTKAWTNLDTSRIESEDEFAQTSFLFDEKIEEKYKILPINDKNEANNTPSSIQNENTTVITHEDLHFKELAENIDKQYLALENNMGTLIENLHQVENHMKEIKKTLKIRTSIPHVIDSKNLIDIYMSNKSKTSVSINSKILGMVTDHIKEKYNIKEEKTNISMIIDTALLMALYSENES